MKKAVVTVLGQDKVGITAKICGVLAETNINILDISQTIVGGYFNMVMVVDITSRKAVCSRGRAWDENQNSAYRDF